MCVDPVPILFCTQRDQMKRFAATRISGVLLFGALSIFANSATGQYFSPAQQGEVRRPLNQLPPIVSSNQAQQKAVATPRKGLYLPPDVKNLPPIVTPQQSVKQPFIYQNGPSSPANSPGIHGLPPIVQRNSNNVPSAAPGNPGPANRSLQPTFEQPAQSALPPITRPPATQGLPPAAQKRPLTSKAGVPIYSSSSPTIPAPAFNPTIQGSGTRSIPQQGSATRSPLNQDSGLRSQSSPSPGSGSRTLPPIIPPSSTLESEIAPPDFNDLQTPDDLPTLPTVEIDQPGSVIELSPRSSAPRSFSQGGIVESTGPVSTPGTNDFFDQQGAAAVPGSPIDVGCSSCGPSGCYDPAMVQSQNGCCGAVVNAGYYFFADALFWTRGDGDVQLSTFFGLNDFNFVGGGRFTLGYRENATQGRELTYFGIGNLDEEETQTSAGGLQPTFGIAGGLSLPTGFVNANLHTQTKETQVHSLEYNRIRWGWELLKSFVGVRYIYFDDSVSFFGTSSNAGNPNALFTQNSVNNLFGVHGGWELFYDVGFRTSASFSSKFGAYVNSADVDTNVFNFGSQILDQEVDDAAIASTIEFNLMTHFQLSPRSRFRAGYDVLLGWGLFTVENNIPRDAFIPGVGPGTVPLTPLTGTELNTNNGPVVFHGPSIGFEIFR